MCTHRGELSWLPGFLPMCSCKSGKSRAPKLFAAMALTSVSYSVPKLVRPSSVRWQATQ